MEQFLETTYDKFIFRASLDCVYSNDEIWVRTDGQNVTIGITDFLQKASGDVAFLQTVEAGTEVEPGQAIGTIETIKAAVDILSPVGGCIIEVNRELEKSPSFINEDPYGTGWIYRIELKRERDGLAAMLSPQDYFELMKKKVAEQAQKLYG